MDISTTENSTLTNEFYKKTKINSDSSPIDSKILHFFETSPQNKNSSVPPTLLCLISNSILQTNSRKSSTSTSNSKELWYVVDYQWLQDFKDFISTSDIFVKIDLDLTFDNNKTQKSHNFTQVSTLSIKQKILTTKNNESENIKTLALVHPEIWEIIINKYGIKGPTIIQDVTVDYHRSPPYLTLQEITIIETQSSENNSSWEAQKTKMEWDKINSFPNLNSYLAFSNVNNNIDSQSQKTLASNTTYHSSNSNETQKDSKDVLPSYEQAQVEANKFFKTQGSYEVDLNHHINPMEHKTTETLLKGGSYLENINGMGGNEPTQPYTYNNDNFETQPNYHHEFSEKLTQKLDKISLPNDSNDYASQINNNLELFDAADVKNNNYYASYDFDDYRPISQTETPKTIDFEDSFNDLDKIMPRDSGHQTEDDLSDSSSEKRGLSNKKNLFITNWQNNYDQSSVDSDDSKSLVLKNTIPGLCGLVNLGNTCFMNSALQCMSNTWELTEYFLSGVYKGEINRTNTLGMQGSVAEAYGLLTQNMWANINSSYSPSIFKRVIGKWAPQFAGYQQQDAPEFLSFLLDGLHEDLNRIIDKPYIEIPDGNNRPDSVVADEQWDIYKKRNDSVIVDLFQGQLKSALTCPSCMRRSTTFDPFMYLTLLLPKNKYTKFKVLYVPKNHDIRPIDMNLVIDKSDSVLQIKRIVSHATGADKDLLLMSEIYMGRMFKILSDDTPSEELDSNDTYAMFELPFNPQSTLASNKAIVQVVFSELDHEKEIEANKPSNQRLLRPPTIKLFGHPMIIGFEQNQLFYNLEGSVGIIVKLGDIYLKLTKMLCQLVDPETTSTLTALANSIQEYMNCHTSEKVCEDTQPLPRFIEYAIRLINLRVKRSQATSQTSNESNISDEKSTYKFPGFGRKLKDIGQTFSSPAIMKHNKLNNPQPTNQSFQHKTIFKNFESILTYKNTEPIYDMTRKTSITEEAMDITLENSEQKKNFDSSSSEGLVIDSLIDTISDDSKSMNLDQSPQTGIKTLNFEDEKSNNLLNPIHDTFFNSDSYSQTVNIVENQSEIQSDSGTNFSTEELKVDDTDKNWVNVLVSLNYGDTILCEWDTKVLADLIMEFKGAKGFESSEKTVPELAINEFFQWETNPYYFASMDPLAKTSLSARNEAGVPTHLSLKYTSVKISDLPLAPKVPVSDTDSWMEIQSQSIDNIMDTTHSKKPSSVSLYECLSDFVQEEQLGESDLWYCSQCKEFQQASKKLDLWRLPQILVIHLKRFEHSRAWSQKVNTLVDFPLQGLDLSFLFNETISENSSGLAFEQNMVYDLYAVSNHYGGFGGGHYTAFARHPQTNNWYNYNDSSVSPISDPEKDVITPAAYMLFYRARPKSPLGSNKINYTQTESIPWEISLPKDTKNDLANEPTTNFAEDSWPSKKMTLWGTLTSEKIANLIRNREELLKKVDVNTNTNDKSIDSENQTLNKEDKDEFNDSIFSASIRNMRSTGYASFGSSGGKTNILENSNDFGNSSVMSIDKDESNSSFDGLNFYNSNHSGKSMDMSRVESSEDKGMNPSTNLSIHVEPKVVEYKGSGENMNLSKVEVQNTLGVITTSENDTKSADTLPQSNSGLFQMMSQEPEIVAEPLLPKDSDTEMKIKPANPGIEDNEPVTENSPVHGTKKIDPINIIRSQIGRHSSLKNGVNFSINTRNFCHFSSDMRSGNLTTSAPLARSRTHSDFSNIYGHTTPNVLEQAALLLMSESLPTPKKSNREGDYDSGLTLKNDLPKKNSDSFQK
ncbi:hypothetical protein BB558_004290 [Smittium angustum]|uniref:ubiquitinyl hydrolase 1 n=1 Tax=Smittium angustum TaxID=133377 RepID=A0A2U1J3M7_SMIAN|nr:hypothetical protein BB558_005614 [Smittium angustum]PVZ99648.1 hypothetical protein BB558_004290 [Smittium angustum]